jgi:predicted nucleic acid-binding protein
MLRAVLDPNVVLAADRSTNTLSPNKEIINRWANSEFTWLVTEDIAAEYAEKLLEMLRLKSKRSSPDFSLWRILLKSVFSTSAIIRLIQTTQFSPLRHQWQCHTSREL